LVSCWLYTMGLDVGRERTDNVVVDDRSEKIAFIKY
jgi:hypothetical protein